MEFVKDIKEKEYTEFVINHPYSHFLKSYEWGEVGKIRGFIPYYVGIKENKKLVATALLLQKKLPLGYSYFYIPRGFAIDYKNYKLIEKFSKEIAKFIKEKKGIFFKIDPDIKMHTIDENAEVIKNEENNYELVEQLKKIGYKQQKLTKFFESTQPRFTFRINLTKENLKKTYSKSVPRWVKIADKYKVEAKIGTKENVKDFVKLMKLTEKRQGFYSHDYSFYPKFYDIFHKKGYVDVLYATVDKESVIEGINKDLKELEKNPNEERQNKLLQLKEKYEKYEDGNQVVSSYFNVNYGNKSWYLYGANNMDYKDTYANYKLFDFQIDYAKELGKEIFDEFGTVGDPKTTKSVAGLHEFKKKFGGEYTEFIGEYDYVTNKFMYILFTKVAPLYRKPLLFFRHLKVKIQKKEK